MSDCTFGEILSFLLKVISCFIDFFVCILKRKTGNANSSDPDAKNAERTLEVMFDVTFK